MAFRSHSRSGRGGFAPRRGGRGGWQTKYTKRVGIKPDFTKHPLGKRLTRISIQELKQTPATIGCDASIKNCKFVASYNWIDATAPTVMVPGKPPLWTPLAEPIRLPEDSGVYFRDPNAARFPAYPTEPAIRALLTMSPGFPTANVDVFGCGSTLGNLLRFARSEDKVFRFEVEVIGNTVFFVRKENDPRETIDDVHGYGHTFPDQYTTWESEVKGSESHQRLNQFDFGGLKCIIRFECDGYLRDSTGNKATISQDGPQAGAEDVVDALDGVTIARGISNLGEPLTVQTGGSPPAQRDIFDLKTRSGKFKKDIDMTEIYPALWLKQFTNFIVAYHDGSGKFEDVRVQNISEDLREWEKANKAAIQRLAVLLKRIVDIARQDGTGLLEVYSPGGSNHCLEIHRQHGEGGHALPPVLISAWEGMRSADAAAGAERHWTEDNVMKTEARDRSLSDSDSDDGGQNFTACSPVTCGYCGKCTY